MFRIRQPLLGDERCTHIAKLGDEIVVRKVDRIDQANRLALLVQLFDVQELEIRMGTSAGAQDACSDRQRPQLVGIYGAHRAAHAGNEWIDTKSTSYPKARGPTRRRPASLVMIG